MQRRAGKPLSILGGAVLFSFVGGATCLAPPTGGGDGGVLSDAGKSADAGGPDEPRLGEPCEPDWAAAGCEGGRPADGGPATPDFYCEAGQWSDIPDDYDCVCDRWEEDGPWMAACAVPGFVGLDRAGRRRTADVSLRRRRAA